MDARSIIQLSAIARLRLLQMHAEAKVGHIGGNLSAIDVLITIQHQVMTDRDSFVLSKGHSAGSLYIALWTKGLISDEEIKTFHQDGTKLAGHPPPNWLPQIPFATGSLGHGASLAAGLALGRRLQGLPGRIFCLLSDGELNEGSTWEALHFAGHHRLNNLTYVVDNNGLQGFGRTADILDLGDLEKRVAGLNFSVRTIDGHVHGEIREACLDHGSKPNFIVAKTVKGKGVSFMEDKMSWHYHAMTAEQYEQACSEVNSSYQRVYGDERLPSPQEFLREVSR